MISEICCNFKVLIYIELQTKIAMITEVKVTEIFCMADDFCKFFDAMTAKYALKPTGKRKYHRSSTMSKAEVMLIMILSGRLLLRKRAIIETVNDELKNIAQVEHSGHRCFDNFIVNLLGAIAAYCLFPKKPCINLQRTIDTQLALFWIRRTHVIIMAYRNILCAVLPTRTI